MVDTVTLVTVGGVTLLFFFWAYGVFAFARDCRRWLPRLVAGVRAWRRQREEPDPEEPSEDEQYLY